MKPYLEHMLTDILDHGRQSVLRIQKVISSIGTGFEAEELARHVSRLKTWTYCFHLEDMVRRRTFASMAVWGAAMGCAIALLTRSFGHSPCRIKEIEISRHEAALNGYRVNFALK